VPLQLAEAFLIIRVPHHPGMDCRYPYTMNVMFTSLPWYVDSGNPCLNDEPFRLAEASCQSGKLLILDWLVRLSAFSS
jgi:hypothetical protein